jgi:hypothetical protein
MPQVPQGLPSQKILRFSGTQTATETRRGPRESIRHPRSPRQALSPKNRHRDQRQRVEKLRGRSLVKKDRAPSPPAGHPQAAPRDR